METKPETKRNISQFFIALFVVVIFTVASHYYSNYKNEITINKISILQEKLKNKEEDFEKRLDEHINDYIKISDEQKRGEFISDLVNVIEQIQPKLDPIMITEIATTVIDQCEEKHLDPYIILALIFVESTFDPMVESNKGAVGLMQVRYETWKETPQLESNGVDKKYKLFWIKENIQCGTDIFLKYYKASNYDLTRTLWRYNSGQPNLPTTTGRYDIGYVNRVYAHAYRIKGMMEKRDEKEDVEEIEEN